MVVSRSNNTINGYDLIYDAKTLIGNSGGPVFDIAGRVVGIHGLADTSAKGRAETGGSIPEKTGFNAGIPINTFLALRSQIASSTSINQDNTPTGENYSQRLTNPQSATDFYARGLTKTQQNNEQRAVEDFNASIGLDTQNALVYYRRGNARIALKEYQGAVEDFNQVILLDTQNALAYYQRGNARTSLKDYGGALEDFNQAIKLEPRNSSFYRKRGYVRGSLRDFRGAIEDVNEATRLAIENWKKNK